MLRSATPSTASFTQIGIGKRGKVKSIKELAQRAGLTRPSRILRLITLAPRKSGIPSRGASTRQP
jgi:hypothetical protein